MSEQNQTLSQQFLRTFMHEDGQLQEWTLEPVVAPTQQGATTLPDGTLLAWKAGFDYLLGDPEITTTFEPPLRLASGREVKQVIITALGWLLTDFEQGSIHEPDQVDGIQVDASLSIYDLYDDGTGRVSDFGFLPGQAPHGFGYFGERVELAQARLAEAQQLARLVLDATSERP